MSQTRSAVDIFNRFRDFERNVIDERGFRIEAKNDNTEIPSITDHEIFEDDNNYDTEENYPEEDEDLAYEEDENFHENDDDHHNDDDNTYEDLTDGSYEGHDDGEDLEGLRLQEYPPVDHMPAISEIRNPALGINNIQDYDELPSRVNRFKPSKPPKTDTGLRVLQSDLKDTNSRVHKLMTRLRMALAMKAGIPCSVVDNTLTAFVEEKKYGSPQPHVKDLLVSASSLAFTLKSQIERFVSAMATTFRPGDNDRVYLGFLLIHRLLHPFSSDHDLTTKAIQIALSYQVNESRDLQDLFTDIDIKIITSRTIFISDPNTALAWNPLAQPMPVMPNLPNETVFACLLRLYSIRRDISCFFRMAWQQAIPSIVAIISTVDTINSNSYSDGIRRNDDPDHINQRRSIHIDLPPNISASSHSFKNLISVANRILECILRDDIAQIFPTCARTICKALFEVGGIDSLHAYILNFLILPNVIKVLRGDHESIENESVHDKYSVSDLLNQYYNHDIWWPLPVDEHHISGFQSEPFNPVNTLIWLVWRLYTGATLLETAALEILTSQGFFAGGPILDISRVVDQKLRNILVRLQHRADSFCKALLSQDHNDDHHDVRKADEMLRLSLLSKEEMAWISRDIYHEIEVVCPDVAHKRVSISSSDNHHNLFAASPVTTSLAQLLRSYIALDDHMNTKITSVGEDLLLLTFQDRFSYGYDDHNHHNESLSAYHDRLYRSLLLCTRYEDSLIRMLYAIHRPINPDSHIPIDLQELIDDKSWFNASECTLDYSTREINLYDHHTEAFRKKVKETQHGFEPSTRIETDNQTAIPIVRDIDNKSRQALFAEMEKTLRFGTSKQAVGTATSIARPSHRVSKTKVNDDDFILGNRHHTRNIRPRYTKSVIHPASSLLIRTEAQRRRQPIKRPNRFDLDKEFMSSMRSHDVISTNKFLRKREAIARNRSQQYHVQQHEDVSHMGSKSTPKPFPSFLRNIVRHDEPVVDDLNMNSNPSPADLANLIINDYNNIFNNPVPTASSLHKHVSSASARIPLPPEPIPGTSHLQPTQSLLNRCVLSKDLLDQLESDHQPYTKIHPRPFRPSGNHIITSIGGQLQSSYESDDDIRGNGSVSSGRYSIGRHSRSSSRDRSRSNSKARHRSRSNSIDSRSSSHSQSRSPSIIRHQHREIIEDDIHDLSSPIQMSSTSSAAMTSSLPSPITYHMEVNQPSTEYVPITRSSMSVNATTTRPASAIPSTNMPSASSQHVGHDMIANQPSSTAAAASRNSSQQPRPVHLGITRHYNESIPIIATTTSSSTIPQPPPSSRSLPVPQHDSNADLPATASKNDIDGDKSSSIKQPTPSISPPRPESSATSIKQPIPSLSPPPCNNPPQDVPVDQPTSSPPPPSSKALPTSLPTSSASSSQPIPPPPVDNQQKDATHQDDPIPSSVPDLLARNIPVIASRRRDWNLDDLRAQLIEGVRVIKHGRSGFPKPKIIMYDEETKSLLWMPASKSAIFSSTFSSPGYIPVLDIKQVLRGIHTEVLSRSKNLDPICCLSIITHDRSLDVVFENTVLRERIYRAIESIVQMQDAMPVKVEFL